MFVSSLCVYMFVCARTVCLRERVCVLLLYLNFVCKACFYVCIFCWMIEAVEWSKFTRKSSSNTETNRKRTEKRTVTDEKRKRAPKQFQPKEIEVDKMMRMFVCMCECVFVCICLFHTKRMNFRGVISKYEYVVAFNGWMLTYTI